MRTILRLALPAFGAVALCAAAPSGAAAQQTVRCESHGYDRAYCNADIRGGVQLSRQLSSNSCVQGRTWGTGRGGIWVSNGCRADFVTGVNGNNGRWGNNGNNNANNGRWNNGRGNNGRGNATLDRRNDVRNNISTNEASSLCRDRVASRRGGSVRVSDAAWNGRNSAYVVNWQSSRGETGTCLVEANRLVTIIRNR
ncbi:MAG: hypothetical protein JWM27_1967 [Gemmatimonadetes bacterium]|nr:hypothetical protein [Gemmatimonadota bacterium]